MQLIEEKPAGLMLNLVSLLNAGNSDRSEGCVVSVVSGCSSEKCL